MAPIRGQRQANLSALLFLGENERRCICLGWPWQDAIRPTLQLTSRRSLADCAGWRTQVCPMPWQMVKLAGRHLWDHAAVVFTEANTAARQQAATVTRQAHQAARAEPPRSYRLSGERTSKPAHGEGVAASKC